MGNVCLDSQRIQLGGCDCHLHYLVYIVHGVSSIVNTSSCSSSQLTVAFRLHPSISVTLVQSFPLCDLLHYALSGIYVVILFLTHVCCWSHLSSNPLQPNSTAVAATFYFHCFLKLKHGSLEK
jgi:hypothetical protein